MQEISCNKVTTLNWKILQNIPSCDLVQLLAIQYLDEVCPTHYFHLKQMALMTPCEVCVCVWGATLSLYILGGHTQYIFHPDNITVRLTSRSSSYRLKKLPVRLVEALPEWGELCPLPGHRWGHNHCTISKGLPMSATSSSRQDIFANLWKNIGKHIGVVNFFRI